MLVGGVIKYVERTAALFSASLDKFKESMLPDPDPGANYAKLMDEYEARRTMNMPTEVIMMEDPEEGREGKTPVRPEATLTSLQVVQYAYKYFNTFKGLLVDLIFIIEERDESRKFFDSLTAEEALRIIEVELGLIYDCLFTKAEILHNKIGVVFRFKALGCLIASLCFFKMTKKNQYDGFDVALTYALLICGIALDSIALLMFCVSDWTIARLSNLKEDLYVEDTRKDRVLKWILGFKTLRLKRSKGNRDGHEVPNRNFILSTWSEDVHAYNLIGFCLGIRPKRIHHTKESIHSFFDEDINNATRGPRQFRRFLTNLSKKDNRVMRIVLLFRRLLGIMINWVMCRVNDVLEFFGIIDLVEEIRFTDSDHLTKELWDFIFTEVKQKHLFAGDQESAKSISSARGNWTLFETSSKKTEDVSDHAVLLRYVTERDYDQSILLWHIATELFYQQDQINKEVTEKREFSKILSDYMMYLIRVQPTLMSAVSGIAKIRFVDTCEEAKDFFKRRVKDVYDSINL